jgi:hypothetical protein
MSCWFTAAVLEGLSLIGYAETNDDEEEDDEEDDGDDVDRSQSRNRKKWRRGRRQR